MHVLSDGSISPNKCSVCETEFEELKKGEERNTFVIVARAKKSTIVVEKPASSAEASTTKKERKLTVKTQKESFKMWS